MNELTSSYLSYLEERTGLTSQVMAATTQVPMLAAVGAPSMSRPVFLAADERRRLEADLLGLFQILVSLPDRLAGGDLGRYCEMLDLSPWQSQAVLRTAGRGAVTVGRADLYRDRSGFRLLEYNLTGAVGGMDIAELNQAMLTVDDLDRFVSDSGLTYVDTLAAFFETMSAWCERSASGPQPLVALVNSPSGTVSGWMRTLEESLRVRGVDAVACNLGELTYRDGRVLAHGRTVDIVYRFFVTADLVDQRLTTELVEPLLRAYERGQVDVFTPFGTEILGAKKALGLLAEERTRRLLTTHERALVDSFLPWTRVLRPGPVRVDGAEVDLVDYCLANRECLILKPSLQYGGKDVTAGWCVSDSEWAKAISVAATEPFVVQRRVVPVPELVPDGETGGLVPIELNWGVFVAGQAYGGSFIRAAAGADNGVVTMSTATSVGCCFHA